MNELRISMKELIDISGFSRTTLQQYVDSWRLAKFCRYDNTFTQKSSLNFHFCDEFIEGFTEIMKIRNYSDEKIKKFKKRTNAFKQVLNGK